jgi:protocatechuate 3,4-dioxygenase beta subunit
VELRTATGSDGAYRFGEAPPWNAYRITAKADSYALGFRDAVQVKSRVTTRVEPIALSRPVRLEGVVVDVRERPIRDALVVARPSRDLMFEGDWLHTFRHITSPEKPLAEVRTDARGRFVFETLSANRYNLQASAKGFAPAEVVDVLVSPGPQREPLRIVLGRGAVLEGTVVDRDNDPIAGAALALGDFGGFASIFQGRWTTTSDENGRFVFPSVAAGQYVLAARAEGHPIVIRAPLKVPFPGKLRIRIAGRAILSGRIKDASGEGIPGALVTAATGPVGITYEMVESGPDGDYRIENLATGQLMFFAVQKEGYVGHPPQGPMGGRATPGISLKAGEETRFDVTLRRGAAVVGTVKTQRGEPIAGAIVRVMSRASFLEQNQVLTKEDGSYRIEGVGTGKSIVLARAPGFFQLVNERGFEAVFSGRRAMREGVEGTIVEVGPDDDEVVADVVLRAACTVEGKVVDSEGKPVAGARVTVGKPDWARFVPFRFDMTGGADVQTVSEADGKYRLAGVHAGEAIRITATSSGYAPGSSANLKLEAGDEVRDVEIRLGAGGLVAGFVRSETGEPVADALVRVAPAGQEWSLVWGAGDPDPVHTDAQGRFEKHVFGTDPVSVRVDADGYVAATVQRIEIEDGQKKEDLEIVVRPALVIEGTVLGPDGSPLFDALVRARAEGPSRGPRYEDLSTSSDESGRFRIEGVDEGLYTLTTQSSLAPEQRMNGVEAGTTNVVIRLPPGRRIAGRVVGPAGEPVPYIGLRARHGSGQGRARVSTDDQGNFTFLNVSPGKWTIQYRPDPSDPGSYLEAELEGIEAGREDVILKLTAGLEIDGLVLDETGSPAVGVTVILTHESTRRTTMTGGSGRFRAGGLPDAKWTISATGPGGAAGRVEDVASGTLDVVVMLQSSLSISGRVVDSTNKPPAIPVYVAASPQGSDRPIAFVTTAPDGTFVISGLPPGKYKLETGDPDTNEEAEATVAAGSAGVTLRLKAKKDGE